MPPQAPRPPAPPPALLTAKAPTPATPLPPSHRPRHPLRGPSPRPAPANGAGEARHARDGQAGPRPSRQRPTAWRWPSKVRLPRDPVLRFSPYAWAKLQFFCHAGDTEIGGFGITDAQDLLLVRDFVTVAQRTSAVTVAFDDSAVADFFDAQVDAGRQPQQFGRHWIHTHPGTSASPSLVDEATFARVFGSCDWALMAILARGGASYARLRFNAGPGGQLLIPVQVDFTVPFAGSAPEAWRQEYRAHIQPEPFGPLSQEDLGGLGDSDLTEDQLWDACAQLAALEALDGPLQPPLEP